MPNREIKFRVYLKSEKKMYDVIALFSKTKDEKYQRVLIRKEDDPIINYEIDWVNVILMQFTWIKDMDWKEICEWDILWDEEWGYDYQTGKKIISFVSFVNMKFCFTNREPRLWRGGYKYHPCRIIGNSYQNPDLIDW